MDRSCGLFSVDPSVGLEELLSAGGKGRIMLSRRRGGPAGSLREVYERFLQMCPEADALFSEEGLPDRKAKYVFVSDILRVPGFDAWLDSTDPDVVVISSQELCHQVCAVVRMK